MSSEFSRWFKEAVATSMDSQADAGRRTPPYEAEEEPNAEGYIENGIVYDAQGNMIDEPPLEDPDFPFDPGDMVGYGFGLGKFYKKGSEIVIRNGWKQIRVAPFGNRTGHKHGKWPHYHARRLDKKGKVRPGQGERRHRPWESKDKDKHWWDRF